MEKSVFSQLSGCNLFTGVPEKELEAILRDIRYSIKRYPKGAVIMIRGEKLSSLMIVLAGSIGAEIQDLKGKTIKIETLKTCAPVAAGILFSDNAELPVTAVAQEDTTLLYIPKSSVIALCGRNETILYNYMNDMGNKIVFLAEKIKALQFTTIREKISSYLLDLYSRQDSKQVRLPYTKETLAEVFGVTRPSLSRCFSELAAEGIISQEGRTVEILDMESLEDLLEEE